MLSPRSMRSTIQLVSLILLFSSLFLAACGGPSGSQGSTQPITLKLLSSVAGDQEAPIKDAIKRFQQANPNVTIKDIVGGDAYQTILNAGLAAKNAPDILLLNGGENALAKNKMIDDGDLVDLTSQPWANRLTDSVKQAVTYRDGKLYRMPWNENVIGVLYNKKIFSDNGLTIPQTWAEFLQLCQKLKAKGITPLGYGGKDVWPNFPLPYAMVASAVTASDPNFDKHLYAGSASFSKSPWLQTLKDIMSMKQQGFFNAAPVGTDWPASAQLLASGKVAMLVQGDWAVPYVKEQGSAIDLGMFPLPYVTAGQQIHITANVNRTFAVYAKSKHTDVALKFLQFFSQNENIGPALKTNGGLPTFKDTQVSLDPAVTDMLKVLPEAVPFAEAHWPAGVSAAMMQDVQGMFAGTSTPETVVADMDKQFTANKDK